jgi:WD40 repeat protein
MRPLAAAFALAVCVPFAPAQEPADPLPKGAVARLGTERMRNSDGFSAARLHPDGKRVIASVNGRLSLIEPVTGTKVGEVAAGAGSINAVAVTPDGKTAGVFRTLSEEKGNSKTVFGGVDLESGKALGESESKGFYAVRLSATPDNKTVIGTSPDTGGLVLFDLATGKPTPYEGGKVAATAGPVLSGDGKRMAVAVDNFSGAPEIQVYYFAGGKRTHTFKGHIRVVVSMAFSPDGKLLATGSADTTILLWDLSKE